MDSEYGHSLSSAVDSVCDYLESVGVTEYSKDKITSAVDLSFGWLKVVDTIFNKDIDNAHYC